MAFFPLSILALAAGIYLLVKVKREFLSGGFEILAWLVIVLSLVSIGFGGIRAVHHFGGGDCHKGKCKVEKEVIINKTCHGGEGDDKAKTGCCAGKNEACNMGGCHMEGDSVVMEKEACEKMMGKEACDKMNKERGRCIVSKEECSKMCSGKSACCKK